MNEVRDQALQLFHTTFGCSPSVVSRAPGRVEVLGNHTDYNEGVVLSSAIDREIVVAASPLCGTGRFEFVSTHFATPLLLDSPQKQSGNAFWANYPLGVWLQLRERGIPCPGVRLAVAGSIPLGAGLSSSAALEVATALALCHLAGVTIDKKETALLCQRAENLFVGTQCGLLDQFSSLCGREGHLLFIDFRTLEYRTIALPDPRLRLALTVSGVSHSLVESAYNDRRRECMLAADYFARKDARIRSLRDVPMKQLLLARKQLDPVAYRRALHVVGEIERVENALRCLESGDIEHFGQLLCESHESSRVNFENSCPQLDELVSLAMGVAGVYGSRLSGGGFGGATLTLLDTDAQTPLATAIQQGYTAPDGSPAPIHYARSAPGASLVTHN